MSMRFADCHNDLLMWVQARREAGVEDPFGDYWLGQLQAGNVRLQVLPIYTDDVFVQEAALRRCLLMIDEAHRFAGRHSEHVALAFSGQEVLDVQASGRTALVLAVEGAEPVGRDLGILRTLHRAGVRMLSLTWNRRTMMADGVGEEDTGGRLTALGRATVAEMEQLGMLLDVSHLSQNGFWDVARIAQRPFVASHSSVKAVHDHPRNLSDEQLAVFRDTSSLVCANAFGDFVGAPSTIGHYLDHVAHLLEAVGPDGVGLGIDFILDVYDVTDAASDDAGRPDHGQNLLDGLKRPADLPALGTALLSRFDPATAAAVAHDNLASFLVKHL